jgi:hypothetical protein
LAGCHERPGAPEGTVAAAAAALKNAPIAATADMPEIAAVAKLVTLDGDCTANLIGAPGSRVMLTAAHCIFLVAQGCQNRMLDTPSRVIFFGDDGKLTGPNKIEIPVAAAVAMPAAYGTRVSRCPAPTDPIPPCPGRDDADQSLFQKPSCKLAATCVEGGGTMGLRSDHDLALLWLAQAPPSSITPLPVLTSGKGSPVDQIFAVDSDAVTAWAGTSPFVTLTGYGPPSGGLDDTFRYAGSAPLFPVTTGLPAFACDGTAIDLGTGSFWQTLSSNANEAFSVPGDSGGALLFGAGPMPPGTIAPAHLPAGLGVPDRRFLAGINSRGGPVDPAGTQHENDATSLLDPDNAAWLVDRLHDFDGDGFSNESDNCVAVYNGDQANCNADAEREKQAAVLGDACDPVPCPAINTSGPGTGATGSACAIVRVVDRTNIALNTVGSHNIEGGFLKSQSNIATKFRFCQIDTSRGITCAVADSQTSWEAFDTANPTGSGAAENLWLPMTFTGAAPDPTLSITYPSTNPAMTWNAAGDLAAWVAAGQIAQPPTPLSLVGPVGGLVGVLGVRAGATFKDTLGTSVHPDNGTHPSPDQPEIAFTPTIGTRLSRHYESFAPRQLTIGWSSACVAYDPLWRQSCPNCATGQLPRFAECPACSVARIPTEDWTERLAQAEANIIIAGLRAQWGLLGPAGVFTLPPSLFSAAVVSELGSVTDPFVARAETDATVFTGTQLPTTAATAPMQAAFLSSDGTTLRGIVRATTLGYQLDGESFGDIGALAETPVSVALPAGTSLADLALGTMGGALKIDDRSSAVTASGTAAKVAATSGAVSQGVLDIDNRGGPVYFYLRQGLTFRGRIAERNPSLPNMLFVVLGGGAMPIEAPFRGTLVAPNASLTLATVGAAGHTGAFYAQSIEVAPDVVVHFRPFTRPDCGDPTGCLGGWEPVAGSAPVRPSLGISARHGFGAVLSATLNSLFVVGGRANAGGAPTHEIVQRRLDTSTTTLVSVPGYAPEDVLATTVAADRALWILDRAGATARLARLDLRQARAQIVWSGPASGAFDLQWLAAGPTGDVLLFSTSHAAGRYAAIHVDATAYALGGESLSLLTEATGVLSGQPLTTSAGRIGYLLDGPDGRLQRVDATVSPGTPVTSLAPWL